MRNDAGCYCCAVLLVRKLLAVLHGDPLGTAEFIDQETGGHLAHQRRQQALVLLLPPRCQWRRWRGLSTVGKSKKRRSRLQLPK